MPSRRRRGCCAAPPIDLFGCPSVAHAATFHRILRGPHRQGSIRNTILTASGAPSTRLPSVWMRLRLLAQAVASKPS
jgi:hypothetical protein